jgi:hypothetical protein
MRRKRSGWWSFLIVVVIITATIGALASALKQDPQFFAQVEFEPDRVEISSQSSRLMTRVQDLVNDTSSKKEWGATFTAKELNCFLHEFDDDVRERFGKMFRNARVGLEGDHLKIGVRYGPEQFSTVVWMDVKAWLSQSEPNCLAVQIENIRAGVVPFSSQSILDRVTEAARAANIDVAWYRNDDKPCGLFRFFSDQVRRSTRQLTAFQLRDGQMTVAGRTTIDGQMLPVGAVPIGSE